MHRSRPFVLVILTAAAACSRRDPAEGNDILSHDRSLVARLESTRSAPRPSVPDACGAIILAATPTAANQQQAEELTRQAGVAEMHGDIQGARSLLRRASALDGTNKSAAYHLGRTSEALGDRTTAMTAYCHYLALAPTAAESVEARQRVAGLSRPTPRAIGSVSDSSAVRSRTALAAAQPPASRRSPVRSRTITSAAAPRSTSSNPSAPVAESPSVTTNGDVVATTTAPAPPAERPSTASRTQRRSSIGVQSAIIGAATGAIFGAATGRSVKSTVIGAAAGGVLGTVVGNATRPSGRSIRS